MTDILNRVNRKMKDKMSPILFIPHGGGPLPLLGDPGHQEMISFLKEITSTLAEPSAILVVSAHWEEAEVTITSSDTPALIYDYYGFPDEAYKIDYPAPGNPALAHRIKDLLQRSGINAHLDSQRGFDHGVFIPLKIMYPEAHIPCVQMSLVNSLDPETHIQIGHALSALRKENVLILGSGFSFHNLKAFASQHTGTPDSGNEAFERWLIDTCTNTSLSSDERTKRLIHWGDAPSARYCHPREEHLLPLHVCYGVTSALATLVFEGAIIGKKASGFLW